MLCGCCVAVGSLAVQLRLEPYRAAEANLLKALVDAQIFLTFLVSFILRVLASDDGAPAPRGRRGRSRALPLAHDNILIPHDIILIPPFAYDPIPPVGSPCKASERGALAHNRTPFLTPCKARRRGGAAA